MQLPATANKLATPALKNIPDSLVFLHLIPLLANAFTMNTYLQCAISLHQKIKSWSMESNDSNWCLKVRLQPAPDQNEQFPFKGFVSLFIYLLQTGYIVFFFL